MKVVFVCVENSCRSQMAEALAKEMFPDRTIEFFSAGTRPSIKVDEGAVKTLEENGIIWEGRPKTLSEIGNMDVIVTMGCEVECPVMPDVKTVRWEIGDPKGKKHPDYQKAYEEIKNNVIQLVKKEYPYSQVGNRKTHSRHTGKTKANQGGVWCGRNRCLEYSTRPGKEGGPIFSG